MEFPAPLAAELAMLTAALDDDTADIAVSVRKFADCVAGAVTSYLGLSVIAGLTDPPFTFTVMATDAAPAEVKTSLMLTLSPSELPSAAGPVVSLICYAGIPGAFVDLAADLSWMTVRRQVAIVLDQHLDHTWHDADEPHTPGLASLINQAVGVLIGRGHHPSDAYRELDTLAADAGTDRGTAAELLLATLAVDNPANQHDR